MGDKPGFIGYRSNVWGANQRGRWDETRTVLSALSDV